MVCTFPTGKQARVMGVPTKMGTGKFLATFQCFPGNKFCDHLGHCFLDDQPGLKL